MKSKIISNSLTTFLDQKLKNIEEVEKFLDDLEDEVFGLSNRSFYLQYKGDIKELSDLPNKSLDDLNFEIELLQAFIKYYNQRKSMYRQTIGSDTHTVD